MENSGSFYFVEYFKILAVFPQMGILSEFGHAESRDKWGMFLSARPRCPRAAGDENPDVHLGKATLGSSKWGLFGF